MQIYFDLFYRDSVASNLGETYIVPVKYGVPADDEKFAFSHDCGLHGELDQVIDKMIADLERLRKKSKWHFDKLLADKVAKHADRS